ncbi:MAG: hypothetical protein LBU32_21580 [Clostridiales bacterium]|jgi:hypothetical protein|nr:hypothetical protein [Clostridiales bacterium]
MRAFDKNEQTIHDALSQITVDASNLARQVKSRLCEESPRTAAPRRVRWPRSATAAIAISAVLVVSTTAVAATLGGFDWFIERFNPSFSEIIEQVEVSCEDQGIRMEVIGAQKYKNKAIVYFSLQDISGQNRLTNQTDFRDGFSVTMNSPETSGQVEVIAAGFSWVQNLLYFDEETNTLYYEFNITADAGSPLSDPLELGSFLIYFDERKYENEPVSVSLANLGEAEAAPLEEEQIWGGLNMPNDWGGFTTALVPGHRAALPSGESDQWLSNIGIIDGKLHVQIGKVFGQEFGSSDASLSLMAPDGELISSDYALTFFGDGEKRLLRKDSLDDASYKYEESVFTVNADELAGYTLCYSGFVHSGVEGKWKVAANLSDTSRQTRIWSNDISVDGHLFKYLTLSPLGLEVRGSYEGEKCLASEMSLALETADGLIILNGGGGSSEAKQHTFNSSWNAETPLDVAAVTAVILNGNRIPVN